MIPKRDRGFRVDTTQPRQGPARTRGAHVAQAECRCGDRLRGDWVLGAERVVPLDVDTVQPELSGMRDLAGGAELKKKERTVGQGTVEVAVRELGVSVRGWITVLGPLDGDEVQLPVANGSDGSDGERKRGIVEQDVGNVPGVHPT
jgi:hypothetical protein